MTGTPPGARRPHRAGPARRDDGHRPPTRPLARLAGAAVAALALGGCGSAAAGSAEPASCGALFTTWRRSLQAPARVPPGDPRRPALLDEVERHRAAYEDACEPGRGEPVGGDRTDGTTDDRADGDPRATTG